ncbi:MAG: trypsin-like peptidase domain-containing protein [Schumannella sp.]
MRTSSPASPDPWSKRRTGRRSTAGSCTSIPPTISRSSRSTGSPPPPDLAAPLGPGDDAVVDGYPYGGPFTSGPAQVLAISTERLEDIYGSRSSTREVYTLAADIEPGNSGGPLLTTDGDVAGVVFARSATDDDLGYAMTNTELAPVAQRAPGLSTALEPGTCVRG